MKTQLPKFEIGQTLWRKAAPHNSFSYLKMLDIPCDDACGYTLLVRDTKTNEKCKLYHKELTDVDPNTAVTY